MNVGSFLSKLQDINNSNLVDVYVPSLQKIVKFKPLSVKNQKDLIKSGLEGAIGGISISNVISSIILENALEEHDYLVTDKNPVILALRKQAYGSFYKQTEEKETIFDLDKILSVDLVYSDEYSTKIDIKEANLSINVEVLTLKKDIEFNIAQIDRIKMAKNEEISDTVGNIFIYEIAKFINTVKIGEDILDFDKLSLIDKVKVVESIPATVNNHILDYIQGFRKKEQEYITVNGQVLQIDARMFSKDARMFSKDA